MRNQRDQDAYERPENHEPFDDDDEEQAALDEEEQDSGKLLLTRVPFSQMLGFGAGTFLAAGMVDVLAHLGPTGLVVAGIAAYVASRHGPDLYEHVREALPSTLPSEASSSRSHESARRRRAERRGERGEQRSLLDRALGRFPEEEEQAADAEAWTPDEEEGESLAAHEEAVFGVPRLAQQQIGPMIALAPNVQIPLRDLAGKAIFICGIRRHGKTTLGALLAEQLGQHYLPLFIPCLEGDYLSLAEVLPRAVIAGHSSAASAYRTSYFVELDHPKTAYRLGYDVFEMGYQVILDLASYASLDTAVLMQINVIRGMFHWSNTHPAQRVTGHIFLDEAQRYLPQSLADSVIGDRSILSALLTCYMDIIAIGGKRGLAPVILTQRFAQVNKKIMAQSEVFFLLRQTNDGDLDRCMEYVNSQTVTKEQIARFQPGQGVYIAADGSQRVLHFAHRQSSDRRSATPQAEAASRYAHMPLYQQRPAEVPSADHSPRRVTMPPASVMGPRQADGAEGAEQDVAAPIHVSVLPAHAENKPAPTLKDAILCWNELIQAKERPSRNNLQQGLLAKGFDCKENWARKFYDEIKTLQERRSAGG